MSASTIPAAKIIGNAFGERIRKAKPATKKKKISEILGSNFKDRILQKASDRNLDGTIPEDIFLDEMLLLWGEEGYGNAYNEKFIECWKGILHCFNKSLTNKGVNVSSATMGAGKTSTALLCLAIHSVLYPAAGSLMVCRRIEECDEIVEALEDLLGEHTALAVHSETNDKLRWKQNVETMKVVLTTHIGFLSSKSLFKRDVISTYNGKPRELVVVDESLGFISRYNITKKFIVDINTRLHCFSNNFFWYGDFAGEMNKLRMVHEKLGNIEGSVSGSLLRDTFSEIENEVKADLRKLAQFIAKTTAEEWDQRQIKKNVIDTDSYQFFDFKQTLVNDILSVQSMMSLSLWATQELNHVQVSSGELMERISGMLLQDESIQSCVILDGTSHIDNIYKLLQRKFSDLVFIQTPVKGVRNYHNVDFFVRSEIAGVGKNTSVSRAATRTKQILDWATEEFTSDDKVIFCGTKKLVTALKGEAKDRDFSFEFETMHWGCIDGRNDLDQYNKIVFISLPFPPTNYHEQSIIAMGLEDELLNDQLSEYRQDANASYIATKVAQAATRDIKRKVLSNLGDCAPCAVYLIFSGGQTSANADFDEVLGKLTDTSAAAVRLLQTTFPQANWRSWVNFSGWGDGGKKGRDQHPAVVKTVKWLETNLISSGDLVEFDDLMNDLALPEKDRKTVKNALRPSALAKKGLGIILKDLGVSIKSKGGRAAYFRLHKD